MSTAQIDQAKELQGAITRAFEAACDELGFGLGSMDVSKRERLAQLILRLAADGESNSDALRSDAIACFREADLDSSSSGGGSGTSLVR